MMIDVYIYIYIRMFLYACIYTYICLYMFMVFTPESNLEYLLMPSPRNENVVTWLKGWDGVFAEGFFTAQTDGHADATPLVSLTLR